MHFYNISSGYCILYLFPKVEASGVQPEAQEGYECSPTQNGKFTENLLFSYQFPLVFVYLMCGPRQLFFQCGPEMPKGQTVVHQHLFDLIYLLQPRSPLFPSSNHHTVVCVNEFVCLFVIVCFISRIVLLLFHLFSLSMILSGAIHVVANGSISFFLLLSDISHHKNGD